MDEQDTFEAEANGFRNLLSQMGDIDAMHDAGAITDTQYLEQRSRRAALASAIARYESGEDMGGFDIQEAIEQAEAAISSQVTNDDILDALAELGALVTGE